MAFAVGSKYGLSFIKESSFGVTPGSPAMTAVPVSGDDMNLSKDTFLSNTLTDNREVTDFRHGNRQAGGNLNFELRYGAFEPFMLGGLGASAWVDAATITASTIAFVDSDPDTITDSGNAFVTSGFKAGDVLTVTGGVNDGVSVTVDTVVAGTITLTAGSAITAASSGTSITLTADRKQATVGSNIDSFSFERRFTDVGVYQVVTGARINTMSLNMQPNSIVTGSFGVLGKDVTNNTSSLDATPTAWANNDPMDSFTGAITLDGTEVATITSIDFNLNNNLSPAFVVGSPTLQQVLEERANVSGTMNFYMEDETILEAFKNETEKSVEIRVSDGTNYYDFIFPRVKFGDAAAPVSGFGGIIINAPFQVLRDATLGYGVKIDKSS